MFRWCCFYALVPFIFYCWAMLLWNFRINISEKAASKIEEQKKKKVEKKIVFLFLYIFGSVSVFFLIRWLKTFIAVHKSSDIIILFIAFAQLCFTRKKKKKNNAKLMWIKNCTNNIVNVKKKNNTFSKELQCLEKSKWLKLCFHTIWHWYFLLMLGVFYC